MATKRKRTAENAPKGLAPGEKLKRGKLDAGDPEFGWVRDEVTVGSEIRDEHLAAACGFHMRNALKRPVCRNKYAAKANGGVGKKETTGNGTAKQVNGKKNGRATEILGEETEDEEDGVIHISDDDVERPYGAVQCSKKACKANPNCLNHLGQEKWEDAASCKKAFYKTANLGDDPSNDNRMEDLPVGLMNLGATCYANAFIQVWFQDLAFRAGVYQCTPPESSLKNQNSPIYQLQVTFAALQKLNQSVFNPVKLVESLQLRASEQQDAQEFSKLFMSHLATEFGKQEDLALQSLITDQFEGKLTYGTACQGCKARSERESDFLELELNLVGDQTLEECLSASLKTEDLNGDNQYSCSSCESLQDAVRYTELRRLPPVLHFSILRFVFDLESLTRKKSKHAIKFPTTVDMSKFITGHCDAHPADGTSSKTCSCPSSDSSSEVYELRGILLHKGTSAYHGHYEAKVFDVMNQKWYQFNDESVTRIEEGALCDKEATAPKKPVKPRRRPVTSKRVVKDSDDELEIISDEKEAPTTTYVNSKDAYMLIYARRPASSQSSESDRDGSPDPIALQSSPSPPTKPSSNTLKPPEPPLHALQEVEQLNREHERACDQHRMKKEKLLQAFKDARQAKMDVYRKWEIQTHSEKSMVVDRQVLEAWLSTGLQPLKKSNHNKPIDLSLSPKETLVDIPTSSNGTNGTHAAPLSEVLQESVPDRASSETAKDGSRTPTPNDQLPPKLMNDQICCEHGLLDYRQADSMKRVNLAAYAMLVLDLGYAPEPQLSSDQICKDCVVTAFRDKLYKLIHSEHVEKFTSIEQLSQEAPSYWISKHWLKDWKLKMPQMHEFEDDPAPDGPQWAGDVTCDHDGLILDGANRKQISAEAYMFLQGLFTHWHTFSTEDDLCEVCLAIADSTRDEMAERKRAADDEKARLRSIDRDNPLTRRRLGEGVSYAIVPSQFIRAWKAWTKKPTIEQRPTGIDNSQFICEHDNLMLDLNVEADLMDQRIALVHQSEWDAFSSFYEAGPCIRVICTSDVSAAKELVTHEPLVCQVCWLRRNSEFEETEVTIQLVRPEALESHDTQESSTELIDLTLGSSPASETAEKPPPVITAKKRKPPAVSYGSRKSKRLRTTKAQKTIRILVSKRDTVKVIKVRIQELISIPTIYQKLFHRGIELADNDNTVQNLNIFTNDTLEVCEITPPDEDDFGSDVDIVDAPKPRTEARAFGGTLLAGEGSIAKPKTPPAVEAKQPDRSLPKNTDTAAIPVPFANIDNEDKAQTDGRIEDYLDGASLICSACTFANPGEATCCEMCETPF